jgi:RimK family alpha-L-glutamate ligase
MTIGIIALRRLDNSKDLPRFFKAAKKLGIKAKFYLPSDIIITIKKQKIVILDRDRRPVVLDGVINWVPYSNIEEISYAFQSIGVPFINSNTVVRNCRNKVLTNILLNKHDILQPYTEYYPSYGKHDDIKLGTSMPSVYKNKSGTHGIGATKFENDKQFKAFLKTKDSQKSLYFQKFIENKGYDFRVVVVGGKLLGTIKKTHAKGEWRTHVAYGGKVRAVDADEELKKISLKATYALNTHFSGIDVMRGVDGKYYVLEANSVPGMSIFHEATGINIGMEILKHLIGIIEDES